MAQHAAPGPDGKMENAFYLMISEKYFAAGFVEHPKYILAGSDRLECESWIDAIQHAAIQRNIIKAKMEHACSEVQDLEQLWTATSAKDVANVQIFRPREAILLQFIADQLMELRHLKEKLQMGIKQTQTWHQQISTNAVILQEATTLQLEDLPESEEASNLLQLIWKDLTECNKCLEWLVPVRIALRTLQKQVAALLGADEVAPGIPAPVEIEIVMQETLGRIGKLEMRKGFFSPGATGTSFIVTKYLHKLTLWEVIFNGLSIERPLAFHFEGL
ncbi:hypothetical protein O6H91_23G055200 [Diphasiastrum complanatum]|uniref:Uncharacterized protein n=1 Tax=Diphasiastrum complanatum TaxID=34168 RepID=A0ACC2AAV3_DIPCM|nr:hypothetical protein O6H91_23G055200 [Diphasiastrum complanatum]